MDACSEETAYYDDLVKTKLEGASGLGRIQLISDLKGKDAGH